MATHAFEDLEVGEEFSVKPDASMSAVRRFTSAARMTFGRFNDHEEARKEGLPGAILPGIMCQGLLVATIHRWARGCEIGSIDTVFRAPVRVDSEPTCRLVVTDCDEKRRTVDLDLTIVNEAGETPVMGTATLRL